MEDGMTAYYYWDTIFKKSSGFLFGVFSICPGKPLVEAFVGITIATILHVANISILEDEPLSDIIENDEFSPGVVK